MVVPVDTGHPPMLDPGEVHLWRVELARAGEILAHLGSTLSHDERDRGDRFRSPRDRARFLAGRAALRAVLGRYTGRDPAGLTFQIGTHGKPMLEGSLGIDFNLSHSGALAIVGVTAGRRIGVDVERVRPVAERDAIVGRFLSVMEKDEYATVPDRLKTAAFFRMWTCKEAYIKALGTGLSEPLDGFSVVVDPRKPAGMVEIGGEPTRGWTIADVNVGDGYVAAIAVEGAAIELRQFDALTSG